MEGAVIGQTFRLFFEPVHRRLRIATAIVQVDI